METIKIDKVKFIDTLKKKHINLFNSFDLKKIFQINSKNTLNHLLTRLNKAGIIKRLIKNKYQFLYSDIIPSDFAIANFLTTSSYISLESALSYYGLVDQFPYRITSIALMRSKELKVDKKNLSYSRIKKDFFRDFTKIDDFLIATKEKAIFDYSYFVFKGLRPINTLKDIQNCFTDPNIKGYILNNGNKQLINFIKKHVKL